MDALDKFAVWLLVILGVCFVIGGALAVIFTCLMVKFFGEIWAVISWIVLVLLFKVRHRLINLFSKK